MTLSITTWRPSSSTGTCWAWSPRCGEGARAAPGNVPGEAQSWDSGSGLLCVAGLSLRIRPGTGLPLVATPGEGHIGLCGMRHLGQRSMGCGSPSLPSLPVVPSGLRGCPRPPLRVPQPPPWCPGSQPWPQLPSSGTNGMPAPYPTDSEALEDEASMAIFLSNPVFPESTASPSLWNGGGFLSHTPVPGPWGRGATVLAPSRLILVSSS